MVHLIFAALFLVGALAATFVAARDQLRAPKATSAMVGVALACASAIAIMAKAPPDFYYKGSLVLALVIATLSMLMMVIQNTPQLVRVGANTIIYFILWLGFLVTTGRVLWSMPGLIGFFAGFLAFGALFFAIRTRIAWLSISVITYTVNAALVVGGAGALLAVRPALWSLLALVGAILYLGADVLSAWTTWRAPVQRSSMYLALLISVGGLLLALSVWGDKLLQLWPPG